MDIKHLIDYLPFYYKDKDTYKDSNGQGILEKFLEICGTYFQDTIKADIDNILEIRDIESTSDYYLRLLWDMLGKMPFARISSSVAPPLSLTRDQQVALIKYTNTLLKIRGTRRFFEVMFNIFSNDDNNLSISITEDDPGWETDTKETDSTILYPYFDQDSFDTSSIAFDEYYRIKQCIDVKFEVNGVINQKDYSLIVAFIKRFVPYFVNPVIYINGTPQEETYTLHLYQWDTSTLSWVELDNGSSLTVNQTLNLNLQYKVEAHDQYGSIVYDKTFKSWLNDGEVTQRTSPYTFTVNSLYSSSDIYYFELGDSQIVYTITYDTVSSTITWAITDAEIISENEKISSEYPSVTVRVMATKTQGGITTYVVVKNQTTGTLSEPGEDGYAVFTLTQAGTYIFCINQYKSLTTSITIEEEEEEEEAYKVYVREINPVESSEWVTYSEVTVSSSSTTVAYQVKAVYNKDLSLYYNGELLSNDDISLMNLTDLSDMESGMSTSDFEKLSTIVENATITQKGYPSLRIQSGVTFTLLSTGTYVLMPKNGSQDIQYWATVGKVLNTLSWSVMVGETESSLDSYYEGEATSSSPLEALIVMSQVSTVLDTDTTNVALNITVGDISSGYTTILYYDDNRIIYKDGKQQIYTTSEWGTSGSDLSWDFYIEWVSQNKSTGVHMAKLVSRVEGTYIFQMLSGVSTSATVVVYDGTIPEPGTTKDITGLVITPSNTSGWVELTSEQEADPIGVTRTYQLSADDTEAKFIILPAYRDTDTNTVEIYDDEDDYSFFDDYINPDGDTEEFGTVITISEPGTYTYQYELVSADEDDGTVAEYATVTLIVQDWQPTVNLQVSPSSSYLSDGVATTKLTITSDKSSDTLMIKEASSGDLYSSGDTYTAYITGTYTFIPVVNGSEYGTNPDGTSTEKTFTVGDLTSIEAEPSSLEWDATDTSDQTITITANDSTEWVITLSD